MAAGRAAGHSKRGSLKTQGSKHRMLVCGGWSHEASIAGTDTGRARLVFSPCGPKSHLHGAPRGCGGRGLPSGQSH